VAELVRVAVMGGNMAVVGVATVEAVVVVVAMVEVVEVAMVMVVVVVVVVVVLVCESRYKCRCRTPITGIGVARLLLATDVEHEDGRGRGEDGSRHRVVGRSALALAGQTTPRCQVWEAPALGRGGRRLGDVAVARSGRRRRAADESSPLAWPPPRAWRTPSC